MSWCISRTAPAALLLAGFLAGTLATVLAGCGLAPVGERGRIPPQATLSAATMNPGGPDLARAAAVARAWTGSPAAQRWEHGYDPLDVPGVWLPPDGFRSVADANAYQADELDLRATLPYTPETGTVSWADGSTLTLPLLPVGRLVKEPPLAANCPVPDRSCAPPPSRPSGGNPGCPSHQCPGWLVVTAVAPGTRQIDTSRGLATIPVWQLTVDGYRTPFSYPAVTAAAGASFAPPGSPPAPGLATVADWTALSPDGLTLTAREEAGGCDQPLPGEVYETDSVVVLLGRRTTSTGDRPCPSDLRLAPAAFRLSRPLGTRDVLDAATGRPLARELVQPGGPAVSLTPAPPAP